MWTEVTKDLVIKEAIEEVGYGFEETEQYFYVMEYLRYVSTMRHGQSNSRQQLLTRSSQEDVLQLVELSEEIRRDRRARIREIEWEREELNRRRLRYDERVYEREIIYDGRRGR